MTAAKGPASCLLVDGDPVRHFGVEPVENRRRGIVEPSRSVRRCRTAAWRSWVYGYPKPTLSNHFRHAAPWVAERGALTALELEEVGRPLRSDGFAGAVDGIQYRLWQGALLHRGEVVLEVGDG